MRSVMLKLARCLPSGVGDRQDSSGFIGVANLDDAIVVVVVVVVVVEEPSGLFMLSRSLSSSLPGPCRRRRIGLAR
jgi:hypothetical protein